MTRKRLVIIAIIWLFSLLAGGTLGYIIIEKAPFLDALFMTVITITTIGYEEHIPLSKNGQIFTIILSLSGAGLFFYLFGLVSEFIVRTTMENFWGKKMEKEIAKLKDHCIICGFGRIGKNIYQFIHKEIPVVVIEKNKEVIEELKENKILHLEGDASSEELLIKAGVKRAKFLVTALGDDVFNLFVTLTARNLNPSLYILARADSASVEKKLYQAGASRVISPYKIGARKMALALLRPNVMDFMEITTPEIKSDLQIEEVIVSPKSFLVGKTLIQSKIREVSNAIILAIKRSDGEMIFNPSSNTVIHKEDILIALGTIQDLDTLHKLATGELTF
ncbi:MAG: potassium channel protein [Thermodesulfobacteriota bacterium]|nr:MAG: potassium channel protein [Thermodesulfobacteriota bacterium]RLG12119.1 MAG: potassium channel protein [Candidatus Pacearchaeota archaeon]